MVLHVLNTVSLIRLVDLFVSLADMIEKNALEGLDDYFRFLGKYNNPHPGPHFNIGCSTDKSPLKKYLCILGGVMPRDTPYISLAIFSK